MGPGNGTYYTVAIKSGNPVLIYQRAYPLEDPFEVELGTIVEGLGMSSP
jgi:hypothetical protein